jgi:hypothetical protein
MRRKNSSEENKFGVFQRFPSLRFNGEGDRQASNRSRAGNRGILPLTSNTPAASD